MTDLGTLTGMVNVCAFSSVANADELCMLPRHKLQLCQTPVLLALQMAMCQDCIFSFSRKFSQPSPCACGTRLCTCNFCLIKQHLWHDCLVLSNNKAYLQGASRLFCCASAMSPTAAPGLQTGLILRNVLLLTHYWAFMSICLMHLARQLTC